MNKRKNHITLPSKDTLCKNKILSPPKIIVNDFKK